jgi:hypothetical protein
VLAAWATALLALGMAVVLSRLVVSVPPVGTEVRPWVGGYLLLTFGALAFAGGAGLDDLPAQLSSRSFSWLQPASVIAGVAVGLVTLTGAAWWVWSGASGPIARVRLNAIPPYVLNAAAAGTRVMAIDLSGGQARYAVIDDDQIRLGDADRGFTFGGSPGSEEKPGGQVVPAGHSDIARSSPTRDRLSLGEWPEGTSRPGSTTPRPGTASGKRAASSGSSSPPPARRS